MKKISFNTSRFQWIYGDYRALDIAKEMGADAVDFQLLCYDDTRKGNLYQKSDEEIVEICNGIRDHAKKIGIEIGQTHGRIAGFKNIPEEDEKLIRNARLDCLATAALGSPYCVMHTTTTIYMSENTDSALMHKLNLDMFSAIIPYAKKYGIKIATETFGDATGKGCCDFFGNIKEFIIGFNRIAAVEDFADYFCVCMDTGHTNKATRYNNNPSPADAIRMLGKKIEVLHLNDNDTFTDQHKIPMTGSIDWNDTFKALDEIGYKGNYNLELNQQSFGAGFEYEETEFAIKAMRKILKDRYSEKA